MEANGCVQRLDLVEIFTMNMLKFKNDIKMVNLFTQAQSTCLPRPGLPVYIGLDHLFTQTWSTCLPRPGLLVYSGLDFFEIWKHHRNTYCFMEFVIKAVPRPREYHHQIRFEKLVWLIRFSAKFIMRRPKKWCSKFWDLENRIFMWLQVGLGWI